MQRHILFMCIIVHSLLSAMEKKTYRPCICINETFYGKTSLEDHLFTKLTERFSDIPYIGLHHECDVLFHRSPLISAIHSFDYLQSLKKNHSLINLATMLKQSSVTVTATKHLLDQLDKKDKFPHYAISFGEGYSFAGYNQNHHGHTYAAIPAAVLYALNTQLVNRIAVIDENLTDEENAQFYYEQGNGSIFFSQDPKLSNRFDNKIITLKDMPGTLWKKFKKPGNMIDPIKPYNCVSPHNIRNFINNYGQTIDLAFYNINVERSNENVEKRLLSIANLLNKSIPTVFILSGDKNKYTQTVYSIIDYIDNIIQLLFTNYSTPRLAPTISTSHASSSCSQDTNYDTEEFELSSDSFDDIVKLVFQITTDFTETHKLRCTNYVYLAKNITIENGVMEFELDENYPAYGGRYYSSASDSGDENDQK